MSERWHYRPGLDGVRALAVAAVFCFHYFPLRAEGGALGVQVFFVLSGFLITSLLVAEHDRAGRIDVRAFYVRRALRLYPALLLAVAGVAVLSVWGNKTDGVLLESAASLLYVNDFLVAGGQSSDWLGHTWSLGVEEQFYLVWPFLLGLLLTASRPSARRLIVIAAVIALVVEPVSRALLGTHWTYYTPLGSAGALLVGAAGALLRLRGNALLGGLGLLFLAAMVVVGPTPFDVWGWHGPRQLTSFAALAVILWAAEGARALTLRPLVWVGRRSYAIYLFHQPILLALVLDGHGEGFRGLVGVPLTLACAAVSFRLVERPALKLKQRFG